MKTYKDEKGNTHLITEEIGNNLYTTSNAGYILHINDNEYINFGLMGYGLKDFIMPSLRLKGEGFLFYIPKGFFPLAKILSSVGGLRYRLLVLYELAKIIYKLHTIGYSHGNISEDMIFVSNEGRVCLLYSSIKHTNDIAAFYTLTRALLKDFTIKYTFKDTNVLNILYNLMQEVHSLIVCTNCKTSFSYINKKCPDCETDAPSIVKAIIYDNIDNNIKERSIKILQVSSIRQFFYNIHTDFLLLDEEQKPTIECRFNINKQNIAFKNLHSREITINGRQVPYNKVFSIKLPFGTIDISFTIAGKIIRNIKIQGDL